MNYWTLLLTICSGIVTVCGAVFAIRKLLTPILNMQKRMEELEQHSRQDLERLHSYEKELRRSEKASQALYRAIFSLITHTIDGNSIDKLKAARDALYEHIIEK